MERARLRTVVHVARYEQMFGHKLSSYAYNPLPVLPWVGLYTQSSRGVNSLRTKSVNNPGPSLPLSEYHAPESGPLQSGQPTPDQSALK